MMILSGCTLRTSDGFTSDEKSICVLQNGRSARIGNTVLYDCSEDYGTYIKLENSDVSRKLDDVSQNFAIDKISSSNQYFYLSGREISDVWGGKTNVLVMDVNGKIIAAKESVATGFMPAEVPFLVITNVAMNPKKCLRGRQHVWR